jgi:hypothetical protein
MRAELLYKLAIVIVHHLLSMKNYGPFAIWHLDNYLRRDFLLVMCVNAHCCPKKCLQEKKQKKKKKKKEKNEKAENSDRQRYSGDGNISGHCSEFLTVTVA